MGTRQVTHIRASNSSSSTSAPPSHASSSAVTHLASKSKATGPRTTALNNVTVNNISTLQSKNKRMPIGKADILQRANTGELSDEDDSHERQAALESPEKGVESRKSSKVSQLIHVLPVLISVIRLKSK
jgi:hypothetical protein